MQKHINWRLVAGLMLLPTALIAATTNADKDLGYNPLLIGLVSLIIILLFLIGMVGNTLRQLTFVYREKLRKERRNNVVKTLLFILCLSIPSFYATAATDNTVATVATQTSASISGIAQDEFYTIIIVIAVELMVLLGLVGVMRIMIKAIKGEPELQPIVNAIARRSFWDRFNNVVAIEKEKDILLDHDYDGIQELDNSLPPWWKYGFYLTIVIAIIYLYRFHVDHSGPSSHEEFVAEMQKAEEDKAAYLAKAANNVDENSVTMLADAAEISAGKEIFVKTCAPCHSPDGGGAVGPNLTDDYWLHGGGIKDVFKSIKYGWQDKGMKSWKDDFSPKQIQELASFVKSLKGTHPATPKAPQGDLYTEGVTPAKTDSAKAPGADSAKANKVAQK